MGRTRLEMLANFLVVLYLVTHGISVPREGRTDLVSGFCFSIRTWLGGQADRLGALLNMVGRPLQA